MPVDGLQYHSQKIAVSILEDFTF